MRVFLLSLLGLLIPAIAPARCLPFDLLESIGTIPYIVHGTVTRSNQADLASAQCGPEVCEHRFDIDVREILKGQTGQSKLHVNYDYVPQRPNISLFSDGDEYVFAIRAIAEDGKATLLGTTCGRSGLAATRLDAVKKALRKR
jgi:hypothetical protein